MKKKLTLFILLLAFSAALTASNADRIRQVLSKPPASALPVMVLDAGHGGMDLGASAPDGTGEPEITLAVTKSLAKEAENYGLTAVLTRTDENGLMEEGQSRWSKLADMQQRRKIIAENTPEIIISIHLNSFTQDTSVRGAQVFYADETSKPLAEAIQESIRTGINDGTDRKVLKKSDMYLFKEASGKCILVECGFLSNPVDLAVLKTPDHQKKLAQSIMKAVAEEENLMPKLRENTEVIDSRTKSGKEQTR